MEKPTVGIVNRNQQCSQCGTDYEAHYILITGSPHDLSVGFCPDCRRERDNKHTLEEVALQKAEIARRRKEWRESCGIPLKFRNSDLSTFDVKWSKEKNNFARALKVCQDYAEEFPLDYARYAKSGQSYPSLVLLSPITQGVGKSHLVCGICHRILDRWQGEDIRKPVQFISEPNLYSRIQSTYSYDNEEKRSLPSEQDIISELVYVPLLVLDDVGTEERYDKKFISRILFALINGRYENNRPIVMTSNLSKEELNNYFADPHGRVRIIDRLLEMCGGKFCEIQGPSYRRK